MIESDAQHYNLFAGEVTFRIEDDIHTARVNTIVTTKKSAISFSVIGQAQQQMQAFLHERMQNDAKAAGIAVPPMEFLDVVILGITWLGVMTKEEFNAPPEGMTMAEQEPMTEEQIKNMIFGVAE